jgi:hypothetical protein
MRNLSTLMKRGEHATPQRALRGGRCGWAGWVAAGVGVYNALNQPDSGGQASRSSSMQDAMSQDLFNFHSTNYRPLEQAAIADATKAGSPEMQESRAAQAGTTVNTAYDNAQKSLTMRRDSMGIRPDSGATMDEERQNAIARAGGVAGAENTARQDERVYGLNAKTQVAGLGRNLPATALSGEAGAANASGIAAQAALNSQKFQTNQGVGIGNAAGAIGTAVRGMNPSPPSSGLASDYNPGPYNAAVDQASTNYGDVGFAYRKGGLIRPPSRTHGYRKGGAVRGPGSGTSDSIPVSIDGKPGAIANGEYVLNAKATKRIGLKRLDRMNLAGLPKGSKMKNGTHVEPSVTAQAPQTDYAQHQQSLRLSRSRMNLPAPTRRPAQSPHFALQRRAA